MGFLIAVILLFGGICLAFVALFALKPKSVQSLDVAIDTSASDGDFSLSRSLLLIGPELNFPPCSSQRKELRRILQPLLQAKYKIVEVYGTAAPSENGQPYGFVDNEALRKLMNAEDGFHLIHVEEDGRIGFHSGKPVVAEALLHIFDLWSFIDDETEEELVDVSDETLEDETVFPNETEAAPDIPVAEDPAEKPETAEDDEEALLASLAETEPAPATSAPDAGSMEEETPRTTGPSAPVYGPQWASAYEPYDEDEEEEAFTEDSAPELVETGITGPAEAAENVPAMAEDLTVDDLHNSFAEEQKTAVNGYAAPAPVQDEMPPEDESEVRPETRPEVNGAPYHQNGHATEATEADPSSIFVNGYIGYSFYGRSRQPETPPHKINGTHSETEHQPAGNSSLPEPAEDPAIADTSHDDDGGRQDQFRHEDFRKAPDRVSKAIKKRIATPRPLR